MKLHYIRMAARQTVIQQLALDVFHIEDSSSRAPVDEFDGNFQPSPRVQCMLNEAAASPVNKHPSCQEIMQQTMTRSIDSFVRQQEGAHLNISTFGKVTQLYWCVEVTGLLEL